MPVTDDQVAALHALLSDDMDRYLQLFGGLDRAEARKGYPALVTAAFIEAVERRFGTSYQPADIVAFVADVRARSDRSSCCSPRWPSPSTRASWMRCWPRAARWLTR